MNAKLGVLAVLGAVVTLTPAAAAGSLGRFSLVRSQPCYLRAGDQAQANAEGTPPSPRINFRFPLPSAVMT